LNLQLGTLQPQETKSANLTLVPRGAGRLPTRVIATANNLSDSADHVLTVQEAQMGLKIEGKERCYVGKNVEWTIRVKNPADAPLPNVLVRDRLPPELQFVGASQQGQIQDGEVVWNLGTLQAREERVLQLTTKCLNITKQAVMSVNAASESGVRSEDRAALEIFGMAALAVQMRNEGGPAEIGKKVRYQVTVTNQGTLPAGDVEVKVTIPAETKFVGIKSTVDGKETVAGQQVLLPKAASLPAGQSLVYLVEVEAIRPGDARCRVDVSSPVLTAGPLFEEEATRIFDPSQAPPVPPPPMLP
jgi:uncharacterized repeat protein (TIGR01451 family)